MSAIAIPTVPRAARVEGAGARPSLRVGRRHLAAAFGLLALLGLAFAEGAPAASCAGQPLGQGEASLLPAAAPA